jgi:hypothetical protein
MYKILMASLAFLLTGCYFPNTYYTPPAAQYVLKIQGSGSWEGTVNNVRVSGTGDRSFPVNKRPVCWDITKTATRGFVTIFVTREALRPTTTYPKYRERTLTRNRERSQGCY